MHIVRHCLLIAALPLGGCITAPVVRDSEAAALASSIHDEARGFYIGLASSTAPQCGYEQNMNEYARLQQSTGQLSARLHQLHAGAALLRAADALARTIEGSRLSHQLASAGTDDVNGICMSPGAIALNPDAIARASQAIADTQISGGQ
jgi:hypothetical protein